MSEKPISDLRRRMIQDMTVRTIGDKTQANYIRHVEALAKFLGRSPDTSTGDDLRRFQAHHVEQGAQPPRMNAQAALLLHHHTAARRPRPPARPHALSQEAASR